MADIIPFPGARHERHARLSSEQREAIVGRWPVRFTTGQALVDRALWVSYRETVVQPQAAPQQSQERVLGSNAMQMDTYGQQTAAEPQPAPLQQPVGPEDADRLQAIRRDIESIHREAA